MLYLQLFTIINYIPSQLAFLTDYLRLGFPNKNKASLKGESFLSSLRLLISYALVIQIIINAWSKDRLIVHDSFYTRLAVFQQSERRCFQFVCANSMSMFCDLQPENER